MKEVTKDEFYKAIGPLDCHPRPVGEYPWTSIFEMCRDHREVGRIVPTEKAWPYAEKFFVADGDG